MRILVTGATGNVGRMVVDELLAIGAEDVRALTVNPAKAALPAGVEVVRGFLGKVETVRPALEGVDVLYLAPHLETVFDVARMAAEAGVRRIVDLAGAKGDHWQGMEDGVEASGVPFTHLEPGEFMANAEIWAPQIIAGDVVRDTCGDAANAPIAQEDIAAVAARVIVEDGHVGRSYEMTGPETLTRREKVALLGRALGRELTYVDLPRAEGIEQLALAMGEYAEWYVEGQEMLVEHPQQAVSTVADLLGRPAMTFEEWARKHAARFR